MTALVEPAVGWRKLYLHCRISPGPSECGINPPKGGEAAEFTSTVLIIPMSRKVEITAALSLAFLGTLNWVMSSVKLYARENSATGS